ncbi:MAG: hypothetical protein U0800_09110 [Isosphaeraceae bacterium]
MNCSRRSFLSLSLRAAGFAPLMAFAAGCGDTSPAPSTAPPASGPVPAPVIEKTNEKKGKVADPQ